MIYLKLLPLLFLQAANADSAFQIDKVRLISCYDGDTCTFKKPNETNKIKVRFFGIDAPEKKQAFGTQSRDSLTKLLSEAKNIRLECNGKKSFKRMVCDVYADNVYANQYLVRNGYAWDAEKYSKGKFKLDQEHAQKNKLGMWVSDGNVVPSEYRKK